MAEEATITPDAPTDAPADAGASSSQEPTPEITYTLTLPENAAIGADVLERTVAKARELGLSNEHAQHALNLVNQEAATLVESKVKAAVEALQPGGEAWTKQVEDWKKETLSDPSLGKTEQERTAAVQKGHAVVKRYADANANDAETFKAFLNESGLGNHPAANRFFAWLGKAMDEAPTPQPGQGSSGTGDPWADAARILYPNTK